jgi:hypothetical protein
VELIWSSDWGWLECDLSCALRKIRVIGPRRIWALLQRSRAYVWAGYIPLICKIRLHSIKSKYCIDNRSSIRNAPVRILSDLAWPCMRAPNLSSSNVCSGRRDTVLNDHISTEKLPGEWQVRLGSMDALRHFSRRYISTLVQTLVYWLRLLVWWIYSTSRSYICFFVPALE